jgi:hypothetical protein
MAAGLLLIGERGQAGQCGGRRIGLGRTADGSVAIAQLDARLGAIAC